VIAGSRVLVLGASGFIGRWVARGMTARGAQATLVVRDAAAAAPILERWGARGELVTADLSCSGEGTRLVRHLAPQIVFNLAGYGVDRSERDDPSAHALNTALVRELAESCGDVRLVHVGSALEYGTASGDLAEDTEPAPTTLYGRTKLAGTRVLEEAGHARGVPAVTARLFTVYGPGEHDTRLFPSLLAAARTGDALSLTDGLQQRDFGYVEDVVDALMRLATAATPPGAVVNVAAGRLRTVRTFIEETARQLGIAQTALRFGALATRSEEMQHSDVNVERMRRYLGESLPADLRSGIARAIARSRELY
jgi:nucleoside-diphosphate-sugar epimerase